MTSSLMDLLPANIRPQAKSRKIGLDELPQERPTVPLPLAVAQTLVLQELVCESCGTVHTVPQGVYFEYVHTNTAKPVYEWVKRPSDLDIPRKTKVIGGTVAACGECWKEGSE